MRPEISIVMPAYNAAPFIAEALASLQRQADVAFEAVVIDDGSSDATLAIARAAAAADGRIVVIAGSHGGIATARNTGVAAASAPFISFLDADDLCPPGRLARHLGRLHADPAAEMIAGQMLLFRELGDDHWPRPGSHTERMWGVQLAAMTFRRGIFERYGVFDPSLGQSEDLDFVLRLVEARVPMIIEEEVASLYRRHQTNITNDLPAQRRWFLHACMKSMARRRATGAKLPRTPLLGALDRHRPA